MRVFLAVPPDPAWVASARDLAAGMRPGLPGASWTRPEAWHLTLAFLGEITESAAGDFAESLQEKIGRSCQGRLAGAGPLLLPPRGRPRVLGVGFAPSPELEALARLALETGRRIGVAPELRVFRPHVTLARLRQPWPESAVEAFLRETRAWRFPAWRVESCVLYRSELEPTGAVHTQFREWRLPTRGEEVTA